MKSHSLYAAVVFAIIPLGVVTATPTVRLQVPPPGRYGIEDLWKAIVNSDTACDAWFEGTVFVEGRGEVFWARTKPFPLTRGIKVYGYRNVTVDQTRTARGYEVFVTRQGTLPEGRYSFKLILQPFGVGDSNGFEVKPMGPPRLISPPEGASLGGLYPDFVWSAPVNRRGGTTYRLRIVEVKPGQTKEEALAANPPWFEQENINLTRLRYPVRARRLDPDKEYAWQVVAAAGGVTAASETRGLKRRIMLPTGLSIAGVTVTRRVERSQTRFKVFLDVKVLADVEDLKIHVWNTGFQCIPPTDAQGADVKASSYSGLRTRWLGSFGNRSGGTNFTVSYDAVPILEPDMFWFQWYNLCDSAVVTYRRNGKNYVRRPDLHFYPMGEVEAAFKAADFVIVTCPARLYPAYDDDDVHYLLRWCGQLARKKNGVLGYVNAATSAPQLKTMLRGDGTWGKLLAPAFRTWGGGYVFIVGEQNIVPAWNVNGLNVPWSDGSVTTQVRLSDFPYSDCTGDWIVDLNVGRSLGRSAIGLSRTVSSAVTFSTTAKPSPACLVSGHDSRVNVLLEFITSTNSGAATLISKGVSAAASHIGSLPSSQQLSAFRTAVQGKKLISFNGHGNVNVWGAVTPSWEVNSLNYATGSWITAFSCLTGHYAANDAICRAFTNKSGTLGYLGSTEVSAVSINSYLQSGGFWNMYHASGWCPGRALTGMKYTYCLFGDKYGKLTVYEYNLYGCPK
ncbi:hypothetical protein JXD38_03080 [candidate division WOR-3 bacterium]|nr:hypothetical protein [candidate division WOR-3 bacterium]